MISAESVEFLPLVKAPWCMPRIARTLSSLLQPLNRGLVQSP